METGVQRIFRYLKQLDSGFRRNDGNASFQTFYEIINFDGFLKNRGRFLNRPYSIPFFTGMTEKLIYVLFMTWSNFIFTFSPRSLRSLR